jgi:hypothetical protein
VNAPARIMSSSEHASPPDESRPKTLSSGRRVFPIVTYPRDAVVTSQQVADALHVGVRTVERMNLPFFKVGASMRYLWGQLLDHWAKEAAAKRKQP